MDDTFIVEKVDRDGKKFEQVSRIEARSEKLEMFMELDVNTEIYPIKEQEKFLVMLTPTLSTDGTANGGYYIQGGRDSIADKFEYIMHGRLYNIAEEGSGKDLKTEIYISFGGLLMLLKANPSCVTSFELDQKLYLCMRKLV